MNGLKLVLIFLTVGFTTGVFSQEKQLSEKEWKLNCEKAKKQSASLLLKFAEHDALVLKNYPNIFYMASFKTRYEEYKRSEQRYENELYKLYILQEDTSGYPFRYMNASTAEKAVKLSDSLNRLKSMREFHPFSDLRMKFDWIANYQTQDYNFIVTEYEILDKEINKQLNYAANLILIDTMAQWDLLQRNMREVLLCNSLNQQTNTNIYFCLESLKARYLENPESTFPPAYDRYFSVYRENLAKPLIKTNKTVPIPDYFMEKVDEPASFPGGFTAFQSYVDRSLRESKVVPEGCGELKVEVKLEISSLGHVFNVIYPDNNPKCPKYVEEAMRIVKASPDWFPARNKGKTVNSVLTVEIVIK